MEHALKFESCKSNFVSAYVNHDLCVISIIYWQPTSKTSYFNFHYPKRKIKCKALRKPLTCSWSRFGRAHTSDRFRSLFNCFQHIIGFFFYQVHFPDWVSLVLQERRKRDLYKLLIRKLTDSAGQGVCVVFAVNLNFFHCLHIPYSGHIFRWRNNPSGQRLLLVIS